MILLDIREYYNDSTGESKPGKKGISLTKEQWELLQENMGEINEAIDELENGKPSKKTKTAPKESSSKDVKAEKAKTEDNAEVLIKSEE